MGNVQRTDRLNSLLREVISEVIHSQIRNPDISELLTVTRVEITKDLKYAKVYIGVIGEDEVKKKTLNGLITAKGFISRHASQKVVMRQFPALRFYLDDTVDKQMRIDSLLGQLSQERENRETEVTE